MDSITIPNIQIEANTINNNNRSASMSTSDEQVSETERTTSSNNETNMHQGQVLVHDEFEITSSSSCHDVSAQVNVDEASDCSSARPSLELQSGSFKENVNSSNSSHKHSVAIIR